LRTWKTIIHLGGLINPLALYVELMVERPGVASGYLAFLDLFL
jgi:hypothetical protein